MFFIDDDMCQLVVIVGAGFKKYCYQDEDRKVISPHFDSREIAEQWLEDREATIRSNN